MPSTPTNQGDVYKGPGKMEGIYFPKLMNPRANNLSTS